MSCYRDQNVTRNYQIKGNQQADNWYGNNIWTWNTEWEPQLKAQRDIQYAMQIHRKHTQNVTPRKSYLFIENKNHQNNYGRVCGDYYPDCNMVTKMNVVLE